MASLRLPGLFAVQALEFAMEFAEHRWQAAGGAPGFTRVGPETQSPRGFVFEQRQAGRGQHLPGKRWRLCTVRLFQADECFAFHDTTIASQTVRVIWGVSL
jgi:hypothetical protein